MDTGKHSEGRAPGRKPIVGLTGGIASGKSAVARVLRELGVLVVDADQLAREVVAPGSDGLAEIVSSFGREMLTPDGQLDRERLGQLVFSDPEARQTLNRITHPRVAELSMQRLAAAQDSDTSYVVYEVPLLVETGMHTGLDATVVVAAAPEVQAQRVVARDGLTAEQAQARIDAQFPLEKKIAVADYVIDNDGSVAQLEARTRALHEQLLARFKLP